MLNQQTEEYEGNRENCTRILFWVVEKVKGIRPSNLPIAFCISATDWVEGGWNIR
ncbi:hypothetical protein [Pedobacter sp. N23S346]|uniref:hypothetical protein n=1 Tax=Pedobacter sp. N23S346 TaxID=3402750 RepID=UPI003AD34E62